MTVGQKRARRWAFTSYYLEGPIEFGEPLTYLVYGLEECPTTGELHWQGYLESKNKLSMKQVKKYIGDDTAHCEIAKASATDNITYCTKDDMYMEHGKVGVKGERSDLNELVDKIKAGKSDRELIDEMPSRALLYHKHITHVRNTLMENRDPNKPPKVIWLYGPSGCGKTSYVFKKHTNIYMKDCSKWWDGYNQQEAILIDDYETKGISYKDLLKITDRYPMSGESKGGYVKINSPFIYITHTEPPEIVFGYKDDPEWGEQLERRIIKINLTVGGL